MKIAGILLLVLNHVQAFYGEAGIIKNKLQKHLKLTAPDLLEQKIIDRIIPEPLGGAHKNHKEAADTLKAALIEELDELVKIKPEKLVEKQNRKIWKDGCIH